MNNVLYSTGCPRCNVLKAKLDEAGIEYDVVSDEDKIIDLGIRTVPTFKTDDKYYNFSETLAWLRSM